VSSGKGVGKEWERSGKGQVFGVVSSKRSSWTWTRVRLTPTEGAVPTCAAQLLVQFQTAEDLVDGVFADALREAKREAMQRSSATLFVGWAHANAPPPSAPLFVSWAKPSWVNPDVPPPSREFAHRVVCPQPSSPPPTLTTASRHLPMPPPRLLLLSLLRRATFPCPLLASSYSHYCVAPSPHFLVLRGVATLFHLTAPRSSNAGGGRVIPSVVCPGGRLLAEVRRG
jgi:hypothetical protein